MLHPTLTPNRTVVSTSGACSPGPVAERLLTALKLGDFEVLRPDHDVTPEIEHRRILRAAGDMIETRLAFSRWHPDDAATFDALMARRRV